MDENSEKFNKELEKIRKNQTELKNTITEMKNTQEGINSKLNDTEELISKLEDRVVQGSPTAGLWISTSLRPVRNWATWQEVSRWRVSKASSATPHH